MRSSHFSSLFPASLGALLAISIASPNCWAVIANFQQGMGSTLPLDFNSAANWDNNMVPTLGLNIYYIQNSLNATISSGSTEVRDVIVGNDSYGILSITGGSLSVDDGSNGGIELGRERFPNGRQGDYNNNGIVDAADYTLWRNTLGQAVLNDGDGADGDMSGVIDQGDYDLWKLKFDTITKGGDVLLTGNGVLTTNGAVVGRRTKGMVSVGPTALLDVKGINTGVSPNVTTQYLRVGSYGADSAAIVTEPGLEADGLVIDQGTVNADVLLLNEHGAKGEFRLMPGGKVDLTGGIVMSYCDPAAGTTCGLVASPTHMSSKLSVIGSGGTFNVGRYDPVFSPPPSPTDPRPLQRRDILSDIPSSATFSFTADAGGVTPITIVDNGASQFSGTANITGTNLLLNLDAYTSSSPLTLINAPVMGATAHLVGTFGAVTFTGTRQATVNYDYANGDVFLNNFHIGPGSGAGSLASSAVPEPSSLMLMAVAIGLLLAFNREQTERQAVGRWGYQWLKVRL
jgi:hypothetical protein